MLVHCRVTRGLVSKETEVLRQWGRETQREIDVSNVSPSSERMICFNEGLMVETSAFNLFTVANLPYQLS